MSCAAFLTKLSRFVLSTIMSCQFKKLRNLSTFSSTRGTVLTITQYFSRVQLERPTFFPIESQENRSILTFPSTGCVVHCHFDSDQVLTVLQPRFERGYVSRCAKNDLQLAVHDHTDLIFFLAGQVEIFDLFRKMNMATFMPLFVRCQCQHFQNRRQTIPLLNLGLCRQSSRSIED